MSTTIKDYIGEWKSGGWHTHPQGDARAVYYPPDGMRVTAVLAQAANYVLPNQPPENVYVVKFIVQDKALYPKLAALEVPDYHFWNGMLVSTPVQVSATEWFTDVIELLPVGTPVPGSTSTSMVPAMRHTLLWNDGLRAKWICCWAGN